MNLVPLLEILSEALHSGASTQAVITMYDNLVSQFGSEHDVLFRASIEKIQTLFGVTIAEGIQKVRERTIRIEPGYDNTYGVVKIWDPSLRSGQAVSGQIGLEEMQKSKDQLGFEF